MQTLRFLPLAAFAGVEGFVLFVPYLVLVTAAAIILERARVRLVPVALAN
jgi:hypothetical protein